MKFADIPQFTNVGQYEVNMPLMFLEEKIKDWETSPEMGLQLNPDFQRGHVWTTEQQIAFVEYFLKGGTSGRVVYFNKPNWGHFNPIKGYNDFVCVDGLQRITALRRFLNAEISIFGYLVTEFEDRLRMLRAGDNLRLNINNLKSKKEVLQWYLEMNTGGTIHTDDEIEKVKELIKKES